MLDIIGEFGWWQKRATVLLWVLIAFVGFPFLIYSFALAKPDFRCHVPGCDDEVISAGGHPAQNESWVAAFIPPADCE